MTVALESDAILKDGTVVHIRPIRPDDEARLIEFSRLLSPQSVYQRFFNALSELPPDVAHRLANVDYHQRMALVAEVAGQPVAVVRWEPSDQPGMVELALVVLDEWQNRGIGRIVLRETMRIAQAHGIRRFRADVLAENRRMLRLLATEAAIVERRTEGGVATLILEPR